MTTKKPRLLITSNPAQDQSSQKQVSSSPGIRLVTKTGLIHLPGEFSQVKPRVSAFELFDGTATVRAAGSTMQIKNSELAGKVSTCKAALELYKQFIQVTSAPITVTVGSYSITSPLKIAGMRANAGTQE